jgi:predicted unusual protein kinase regulating ubiquinone biosynthesis (AarF/ABC1/UbiB family)
MIVLDRCPRHVSCRLVLLDFGAARPITPTTSDAYRSLLLAGLAGELDGMRDAAVSAGFLGKTAAQKHRAKVNHIIGAILKEFHKAGIFDFGDRQFVSTLREEGAAVAGDRSTWHVPPADMLFAQRKVSGTALLAARLKAQVNVRSMIEKQLGAPAQQ